MHIRDLSFCIICVLHTFLRLRKVGWLVAQHQVLRSETIKEIKTLRMVYAANI